MEEHEYRTLFVGKLVQESALSVGGNRPIEEFDEPLCRDGLSRLTLRGDSLAGALVATARKLYRDVPDYVSGDASKTLSRRDAMTPSLWRVFTSHPIECEGMPEARQGVGIRQATGAAAEGVLFDAEVIPRGVGWWFCLEVDTCSERGRHARRIAVGALQEWQRGRCWLGRSVARGMGWMRLDELRAFRLDITHAKQWPNSHAEDHMKYIEALPGRIESDEFPGEFHQAPDRRWHYAELTGRLVVGEREDGYGIDGLSVGSHASVRLLGGDADTLVLPRGQRCDAFTQAFAPDSWLAMTIGLDGKPEPFIPGSALRGPLRHAISRELRSRHPDLSIRDPNVRTAANPKSGNTDSDGADADNVKPDAVERLFGSTAPDFTKDTSSAALLVRDAYLVPGCPWKAAPFEHHAEDEFSGGVFASSKFNRVALVQGEFEWKMVIEASDEDRLRTHCALLADALRLAQAGHLAVGGGQWRGLGWVRWTIDENRCTTAGQD